MKNSDKNFYITTTLPYANAKPHIGFAMEIVRADVVARYRRLCGRKVFFNTGTDEHGTKIFQKAEEEGKDVMTFLDEKAGHFIELADRLNIKYDRFIRTTDKDHELAAQNFWKLCDKNGYIYKKEYSGLYCVGCEIFINEKDLVNGECKDHPGKKIEEISEENYFFKYSEFEKDLLQKYADDEIFVIPANRQKEISNFVETGLEDFSISRLKEKMPWGVPVPGDDEHVMYVWFDALVNYISTLGWGNGSGVDENNPKTLESDLFKKFWTDGEVVQYCGKDNLQFQAARWQAMLLSNNIRLSDKIIINGFITSGGQKMSKTVGNVIDPIEILNEYGTDALRYYLVCELHPFEDSDFTIDRFKEAYNANLANGIGNLTNRIMKMAGDNIEKISEDELKEKSGLYTDGILEFPNDYKKAFSEYNLQKVSEIVWEKIGQMDAKIQETEPFKLIKTNPESAKGIIGELVIDLYKISKLLEPILPETAEKIMNAILKNQKPENPLFERID